MENEIPSPAPPARPKRSGLRPGLAVGAVGLLGGAIIAGASIAAAATPAPTPGSNSSSSGAAFDPTKGGHVGANGVVEKLLTGTTAEKARAAALAAVPGATIERVENDAEGAVYEAHMLKSDGTHVTVKMDANFKVTGIENGPGR